jgi:alkaline phosphatase D
MPEVDDDSVNKLKIAVFSCSNLPWGYFNAFRQAAEMDDVDLAVHVGDYIYENRGDGGLGSYGDGRALNRVPEPNKEIVTLSDYRLRYASYRRDPDLQALHQKKAWLLVWDDHEASGNLSLAFTCKSPDRSKLVPVLLSLRSQTILGKAAVHCPTIPKQALSMESISPTESVMQ